MSRVSIIVLTFNRRAELQRTLERLCALPGRHPVIVVDNGSRDGSGQMLRRRFPQVELIGAGRNLGAAGRNLGVARAATPYVAFCDDDTCWQPGALEQAEQILDAHPDIGVLNARILVGDEERPDPACERMARSPLPGCAGVGPGLLGFMAGACVMRTQAFRQAGGYWNAFFIGGEETLLALDLAAAGWRMVYAPRLTTRHWPSPARDDALRRRLLARNAVWTAWMRLPAMQAWRTTRDQIVALPGLAARAGLLAEVLRGAPKVLTRRKVISAEVEQSRRLLSP